MRVLFVTDSYKPAPSPNAICVDRLKTDFEAKGIDCNVIALRTFSKRLQYTNDSSVSFVEPDYIYNALFDAQFTNDSSRLARLLNVSKIRGALYGMFWPLVSLTHLRRYVGAIGAFLSQHKDEEVAIIGVYKSLEAALACAIAKKMYGRGGKRVYYLYTLDAVAGSIIPPIFHSTRISTRSILRWERFMFKTYDYILMMNSHRNFYSHKRYDKIRHKIEFVDIPLLFKNNNPYTKKQQIHFVFTGSMAFSTADPRYFLNLLNLLNDDRLVFDIYGKTASIEIRDALNNSKFVRQYGAVSHEDILKVQANADVLVNFGNFTPCAVPCKIFEYFSSLRPVISFCKIDQDSSLPYIKQYPNSLVIDERIDIYENLLRFKNFVRMMDNCRISDRSIREIFEKNTPDYTTSLIISKYRQWVESDSN